MSDDLERSDLRQTLQRHRGFLRATVRDLTDAQARERSTVSELTLASLLKHVADSEAGWIAFIHEGPHALGGDFDASVLESGDWHDTRFDLTDDETVAVLLARLDDVAARTEAVIATVDLDSAQPLPKAPWFEPGASWSARRVVLHVTAELSQHAGHADIIREAIDGAKTMG